MDLGIESLQVLSIELENVSKKEFIFGQPESDPIRIKSIVIIYDYVKKFISI